MRYDNLSIYVLTAVSVGMIFLGIVYVEISLYGILSQSGPINESSKNVNATSLQGQKKNTNETKKYPTKRRYVYERHEGWVPESRVNISPEGQGTYEVTRYPNAEPTEENFNAAWRLYNESFEAAKSKGWFDFEEGYEVGYNVSIGPEIHYYNVKYLLNGEDLNPHKPESIIYYEDPHDEDNKILAGYMYLTLSEEGKQIGGPLTAWHYHPLTSSVKKLQEKIVAEASFKSKEELIKKTNESLRKLSKEGRGSEMIHVWFVNHPQGPFGSSMGVPEESLNSPQKTPKKEFKDRLSRKYNRSFEAE